MGQQPNKYLISDDGKVYRVNRDGSFTQIGNVEDLEMKPTTSPVDKMPPIPNVTSTDSSAAKVGWWKRNYNWLWSSTLILFIGWIISCLSCRWTEYPIWNENGYAYYYYVDNILEILIGSILIIVCYCLSWYMSRKNKIFLKLMQIILIGGAACGAHLMNNNLCEPQYSFLLDCIASIPLLIWFVTLCLSWFRRNIP